MNQIDNIYITGGGFKTLKYYGAIRYLYNNNLINPAANIYCSSAGVLAGIAIILYQIDKEKFEYYVKSLKEICNDLRINKRKIYGCGDTHFVPLLNEIINDIEPFKNKLHISITTFNIIPRNIFISDFQSKEELIDAVKTTMHIPYTISKSLFVSFRNIWCMDGGITNNCMQPNGENSIVITHGNFSFYNVVVPISEQDINVSDIESDECIIYSLKKIDEDK